jgi:hypothetical protein
MDLPEGGLPGNEKLVFPKPILLTAAALSFTGAFLGSALVYLLCQWQGIDMKELTTEFSQNSPEPLRHFMRGVLLLNHMATFLIPASFLFKKETIPFLHCPWHSVYFIRIPNCSGLDGSFYLVVKAMGFPSAAYQFGIFI